MGVSVLEIILHIHRRHFKPHEKFDDFPENLREKGKIIFHFDFVLSVSMKNA